MDAVPGDSEVDAGVKQGTYLRTTFLEALAHELRGPSGVTLGALDELELALGENAKQYATLLAMARRGVRRVLRSADRLGRTAQFENGSPAMAREDTDLRKLAENALQEAELVEARRGVKADLKLPTDAAVASVDASWLKAALGELIGSALRSARRSVVVELSPSEEGFRFIVRDDGVSSQPPRLQRFEHSDDRRDAGLAFPFIREVAEAHNGQLSIRAGENGGLQSTLTIPGR